jgi:hypothetical protein
MMLMERPAPEGMPQMAEVSLTHLVDLHAFASRLMVGERLTLPKLKPLTVIVVAELDGELKAVEYVMTDPS